MDDLGLLQRIADRLRLLGNAPASGTRETADIAEAHFDFFTITKAIEPNENQEDDG
ncbi:hypothetical protein [Actinokineospora iranica]|uniref:Uncharacterized protein n=1 Tax=Actinokineospora iranica TaxID=1271860 RepID=A0A1G6VPH2_9PSEU|nr:hypothetical protein [Actinokineospora iranica]SDD54907.1 hypothetical protein SAMN05216174_1131 [Actinokineospora iranica]